MAKSPHIVVVGLGVAGSSITASLAQRGMQVTAIEQFQMRHDRGSSHGDSRIFRRVPHEGKQYVDLASKSFDGWRRWSAQAKEELFTMCGGLDAGSGHSDMVAATERLCKESEHQYEIIGSEEINKRFHPLNLPSDWHGVYQPESGVIKPEATLSFLARVASSASANLLYMERVLAVEPAADHVVVRTNERQLVCDLLIVSAGAWLPQLITDLGVPLIAERRVVAWYSLASRSPTQNASFPVFCLDADGVWYGMPTPNARIKIGNDQHFREQIDPTSSIAAPTETDAAKINGCVASYFDGLGPSPFRMETCVYTNTPDNGFIIDRHPQHPNIVIFSCCSGHGFKYAPVYGEIASEIVSETLGMPRGSDAPQWQDFNLRRFQPNVAL